MGRAVTSQTQSGKPVLGVSSALDVWDVHGMHPGI